MKRTLFTVGLIGLTAAPAAAVAQPTPGPDTFDGQLLTVQDGYVLFSSGDAVKLAKDATFDGLAPKAGTFVRVTIDPRTNAIVHMIVALHPFAGGTSVTQIPRAYVIADPRSARKPGSLSTAASGQTVPVTIVAEVPANTPAGDQVYLSTERSNWSAAEQRMDQIDALHWSTVLPLPEGSVLHYKFTRGSYATSERDRAGADVAARMLVAKKDVKTSDVVLRWADLR